MPNQYSTYRYPITQRDWLTRRRVLFQDLGDHNFVVEVGGDIQKAIDNAEAQGGGIIRLGDGTHSPTTDLTIPPKTPIQFLGVNMSTTVINFGTADRRFILAGENMYTTGTVSISSGVTVTGSSTNWLSSGLVAGDEIFLDSRWYKIAAIPANTTIILAEGYGGSSLSGATYRAGSIVRDIEFTELSIINSTSSSGAIDIDDGRNILLEDVTLALNAKHAVATNFSEWNTLRSIAASATGDGVTFTTGTFCNNHQFANVGNGGHGFVLSGMISSSFIECAADGNTTDGFNITGCTNVDIIAAEANGNGGQGIECVSGNSEIKVVNARLVGNASDGLKLTATSDYCKVTTSHIAFNGGYGINIAASTCDNNIITTTDFLTNTSGAVSDSGTGTVIRGNVGVDDNANSNGFFVYSASDTLQESADTERTNNNVSFTKVKEIQVNITGGIRTKFDMKHSVAGVSAHGQVFVNGVAVGSEANSSSTNYITYTDDISVQAGDLVQLYAYEDPGTGTTYVRNFRVHFTKTFTSDEATVITD